MSFIGERDILSLQVECINNDCGCSWKGELREMEKHAKECSQEVISCPYEAVGCEQMLLKKTVAAHKSDVDHLAMAVEKIELLNDRLAKAEVT